MVPSPTTPTASSKSQKCETDYKSEEESLSNSDNGNVEQSSSDQLTPETNSCESETDDSDHSSETSTDKSASDS